jgi:hypothetical protein
LWRYTAAQNSQLVTQLEIKERAMSALREELRRAEAAAAAGPTTIMNAAPSA